MSKSGDFRKKKDLQVFTKIETVFPVEIRWSQKKKFFTKIQSLWLTNFGWAPEKKISTFLVQITTSPSQLLLPNPVGGLFSFLEQKSVTKALKTCYFAYFLGQWGAVAPLATLLLHCAHAQCRDKKISMALWLLWVKVRPAKAKKSAMRSASQKLWAPLT